MRASKKVKGAVLLTAGAALILGAPTVYASDDTNNGNGGILSGLSVLDGANLNVPVTVDGLGVLGEGKGRSTVDAGNLNGGNGGRGGNAGEQGDVSNDHNHGLLSGLSVGNNLDANVPVTVDGAGVLGSGRGKSHVVAKNGSGGNGYGHGRGGHGARGGDVSNDRNEGILSGVSALNNSDLNVPVTLCGVGVLGRGAGDCTVIAKNGSGGRGGHGLFGGHGGRKGDVSNDRNEGLLTGLSVLNNADLNVPVTVCGLAVLGRAGCSVDVVSGNRNGGGFGGHRGGPIDPGYHHEGWHDRWENSVLPETGATGLALLPFGLALVAGGAALRRRVASQR
jgi:hypothetical protein